MSNISDIIRQIAKTAQPLGCLACEVTAVDKTARTVDCQPLNEDAPILACNLQADQEAKVGLVQFPRVGSYVLVAFSADGSCGFVTLCEDVESVEVVINDKTTASIVVSEQGVVMNDGTLGGLVKVEELTNRINLIEKDINKLKDALKNWTPVPHDGGAALKTASTAWAASKLTETKRSDYENEKVKQ